MGFWSLLKVASMPIVQVLLISILGAFMATDYFMNLLSPDARRSLNKIVFVVFTPSLAFASLVQTVRFEDIISWWFMPVNVGIIFLIGGILGWIAVKILKPEPHIGNLIIAMSSAGNLGNIMLIIIPAICKEDGSPFGDKNVCSTVGLSYVSFSLAIGGFYIWTHTFHLIRTASTKYKEAMQLVGVRAEEEFEYSEQPNNDLEANKKSPLLINPIIPTQDVLDHTNADKTFVESKNKWNHILGVLHQLWEELMSPPIIAAIIGFIFGSITFLRKLLVGDSAPLRVIYDSIKILGDGTIPCITLILGGNLTQGLKKANVRWTLIVAVNCVRYIILPIIGIGVVKGAAYLGFLPSDPLYRFVLLLQFTLPPAMNIGTMTQLFDVAQEECSVLFLWTYLVAIFALTGWSTVFMSLLSYL